jgi:hypothetical protein
MNRLKYDAFLLGFRSSSFWVGFADELMLTFPVIHDRDQAIAASVKATRTAEVVAIDAQGQIVYRGRVDDPFAPGIKRAIANNQELLSALQSFVENKPIKIPSTQPTGCLITFGKAPSKSVVTESNAYAELIAPIFNRHCIECHRSGEIGPFDMTQHEDLPGWGDMIVEVLEQKRMPPWHASPDHLKFKNGRHVPAADLERIKQWVAAGCPLGDLSRLPPTPAKVDGWRLSRAPDQVVAMRSKPVAIPAEGTIDYQYFVVDPKLTEDCWVSAAQVVPGDASVVHHTNRLLNGSNSHSKKSCNRSRLSALNGYESSTRTRTRTQPSAVLVLDRHAFRVRVPFY